MVVVEEEGPAPAEEGPAPLDRVPAAVEGPAPKLAPEPSGVEVGAATVGLGAEKGVAVEVGAEGMEVSGAGCCGVSWGGVLALPSGNQPGDGPVLSPVNVHETAYDNDSQIVDLNEVTKRRLNPVIGSAGQQKIPIPSSKPQGCMQ